MRSGGVHIARGSHLPVRVRVPGFSPASRLAPPPALQVCFTLLTPFGFSLQGFPLPRSRFDSSSNVAVMPLLQKPNSLTGTAPWRVSRLLARPDDTFFDFTALLPLRVRCACLWVNMCMRSRPSWAFSSSRSTARSSAAASGCSSFRVLGLRLPPKRNRLLAALQSLCSLRAWRHLFRDGLPFLRSWATASSQRGKHGFGLIVFTGRLGLQVASPLHVNPL